MGKPQPHEGSLDQARRQLARFMAVGDGEWELLQSYPMLSAEVVFHAVAILYCSAFFGWANFNIALGLLGYPVPGALLFALGALFGLGTIDRYMRIQSRGAADNYRTAILKVRLASVLIVAMSSFLMATNTFRDDIARVLGDDARALKARLEGRPDYAVELASARQELDAAAKVTAQADETRRNLERFTMERAQELAAAKDECEGNVTGNEIRRRGCGPRARGHETAAQRLAQQIEASQTELQQLGDVQARQHLAQTRLAKVNLKLDETVAAMAQGQSKRLEALVFLMQTSFAAVFSVLFWILVGMLPDVAMWIAFGRSPNDASFANVRKLQEEAFTARLTKYRAELRAQAAEGLRPLDVRVALVPKVAARPSGEAANEPV